MSHPSSRSTASTLTVDRPITIAAAALLSAVAILVFNAMPLILGAAANSLALPNQKLGYLGSAYLAGHALMTIALIFWIRTVAWRLAIVAAAALQGLAFALASQAASFSPLAAILFVAGLGGGALFGIAVTCQADSSEPDRNLGIGTFAQVVLPAVAVLVLPTLVIARWGFAGVLWVLVAFAAIAGLLAPGMPRASERSDAHAGGSDALGPKNDEVAWIILGAASIFIIGNAALWAYVERVGDAAGLAPEFIGKALSAALVAGGLGSLVPVFLGQRFGRWRVVTGAIALQVAAVLMLSNSVGAVRFVAVGALFMFGWTVSVIYQLAGAADLSARAAATVPAVIGIASAAGPALAGSLLGETGFERLFALTLMTLVGSWAIFSYATRRLASAPTVS